MLTYTLNKIIKTLEIAVFLSPGVMLTGVFVLTPSADRLVAFHERLRHFVHRHRPGLVLSEPSALAGSHTDGRGWRNGACVLIMSFGVFFGARAWLDLNLGQLQTLMFLMLVFSGQGVVYLVRERGHFWQSIPGRWLLAASLADIAVVSLLATKGILMAALEPRLVAGLLMLLLVYLALIDIVKVRTFRRLGVQ